MIPHNNIGLSPTTWSVRKDISINFSTGTSRIWICSWDNLEDDCNIKFEKIVLKEPSVSLNIGWIWENHSFNKVNLVHYGQNPCSGFSRFFSICPESQPQNCHFLFQRISELEYLMMIWRSNLQSGKYLGG